MAYSYSVRAWGNLPNLEQLNTLFEKGVSLLAMLLTQLRVYVGLLVFYFFGSSHLQQLVFHFLILILN